MSALLLENFEALAGAPGGIKKLRELILELAVRGKLVPQDPNDEPAESLLAEVQQERLRLMEAGRIKKEKPAQPVAKEDVPCELPVGWAWGRIGDTAQYINGLAFKPGDWGEVGRPIIRIQNLSGRNGEYNRTDRIVDDSVVVRPGDILVSWSATLDAYYWTLPEEGVLNQHIFRVIPSGLVEKPYLYLLLKAAIREMEEGDHAHGLVMTHINRGPFLAHIVGIPPLSEQSRIVAKVDELMALCDQLESRQSDAEAAHEKLVRELLATLTQGQSAEDFQANWQRLTTHFDTLFTTEASIDALKQAILRLAVMGRLVPQDMNDESAAHLLARVQAEQSRGAVAANGRKEKKWEAVGDEERPFEVPTGWVLVRLGQVVSFLNGYAFKSEWFSREGVRLLRNINVSHGVLDWGDSVCVPADRAEEFRAWDLSVGDVVLSLDRPLISSGLKYAVVEESDLPCLLLQRVAKLAPVAESILADYLVVWLTSEFFTKSIDPGRSNGVPHISTGQVAALPFVLPPISEQSRIVKKVDELFALCDTLKARFVSSRQAETQIATALIERAVA